MKNDISKTALFVFLALSLNFSGCSAISPEPTLTASPANTATDTPEPSRTPIPSATVTSTRTPKPTATPDIAATQKYESLQKWVDKLASEAILPSTEGKYYVLDDFSDSFAKSRYYGWVIYPDLTPSNFIMQAKVKIANDAEETYKAGCGFVIQNKDYYVFAVFFSLDGNANYYNSGFHYYSKYLDNTLYDKYPDGLTLTMVLSNRALFFYVNGEMALSGITIYEEPYVVGPAILSGTSEGFGTRCDFTEVTVWQVN